jgi:hypothetical protein
VKRLKARHGLGPAWANEQALHNQATQAIMKYGNADTMTLTLEEFPKLLLAPEWASLLPAEAKDGVILASARLRAESIPGQEREVGSRSPRNNSTTRRRSCLPRRTSMGMGAWRRRRWSSS